MFPSPKFSSQTIEAGDGVRVEVGTMTHDGRGFMATGAVVAPNYLACYPAADGTVKDWGGNTLGTYRVLSSRPAVFFGRQSWQGSRYYFMRATVNGTVYALRGFGVGMLARGRAVKGA